MSFECRQRAVLADDLKFVLQAGDLGFDLGILAVEISQLGFVAGDGAILYP